MILYEAIKYKYPDADPQKILNLEMTETVRI